MASEEIKMNCRTLRVGGQAVMEGVMMKGKEKYAVSVRRTDQSIITGLFDCPSVIDKYPVLGLPVIRGAVRFFESFVIGMKTLNYSSSFFIEEELAGDSDSKAGAAGENPAAQSFWKKNQEKIITGISILLGVVLALGIFVFLPSLLSSFLSRWIRSRLLLSFLEGVVRVGLFIGYILLISRMKDIRRLFEYHGAEHKTINCLEDGKTLTPENVMPYTRLNRRCGTSFIFLVMFISILFFAVISVPNLGLKVLLRILLIPVVAGVSYEILMLSNRYRSGILNVITWPGLQMQKLTTREPDESQVETAIASTLIVLEAEGRLPEHLRGDLDRVRGMIEISDETGKEPSVD